MVSRSALAGLCLALGLALGGTPALAQSPAVTGTGTGPASTITAPNTTATGTTKPPGAAAGAEPVERSTTRTGNEQKADKLMQGICIGCGVK